MLRKMSVESPVVIVTGARQVGKSTLLRNEAPFSRWRYVSMDDYGALQQAQDDPESVLAGRENLVLDEVQRVPGLLNAIKAAVDRDRPGKRYVLSGSANLLLMSKVTESLAGRALSVVLEPMTWGEQADMRPPGILKDLLRSRYPKEGAVAGVDTFGLMQRGFVPPLLTLPDAGAFVRWWEGYVATYLERDLRQLSQVDSLPDFRKVMVAVALRTGQLMNQTGIARDTGVSQPTVHRYLNILETSCLINRVPAFTPSRAKRIVKSPKAFWFDPGLASFLAGYYDGADLASAREAGGMFEGLVLLHLKALAGLMTPRPRIYYWRTSTGHEVDFVVEHGRKVLPIEVKATAKPAYGDTGNLRLFLKEYDIAGPGVLVHTGTEIAKLDRNVIAVPWTLLAGQAPRADGR